MCTGRAPASRLQGRGRGELRGFFRWPDDGCCDRRRGRGFDRSGSLDRLGRCLRDWFGGGGLHRLDRLCRGNRLFRRRFGGWFGFDGRFFCSRFHRGFGHRFFGSGRLDGFFGSGLGDSFDGLFGDRFCSSFGNGLGRCLDGGFRHGFACRFGGSLDRCL